MANQTRTKENGDVNSSNFPTFVYEKKQFKAIAVLLKLFYKAKHSFILKPYFPMLTGTGTFGNVVLAQDTETGEYSALKILSMFDLVRMKQVDHVKNEKNILKAIKHPFIISL